MAGLGAAGAVRARRGDGEAGELLRERDFLVELLLGESKNAGSSAMIRSAARRRTIRPRQDERRVRWRTFCHAQTPARALPSWTVMQIPPRPLAVGRTAVELGPGAEGLRVASWWAVVKSWRVVEPEAVDVELEEVRITSEGGAMAWAE